MVEVPGVESMGLFGRVSTVIVSPMSPDDLCARLHEVTAMPRWSGFRLRGRTRASVFVGDRSRPDGYVMLLPSYRSRNSFVAGAALAVTPVQDGSVLDVTLSLDATAKRTVIVVTTAVLLIWAAVLTGGVLSLAGVGHGDGGVPLVVIPLVLAMSAFLLPRVGRAALRTDVRALADALAHVASGSRKPIPRR